MDKVRSATNKRPEYHFGSDTFKYRLNSELWPQEEPVCLSSFIRFRTIPRIAGVVFVVAGLFVLPACWVESINPLYEESTIDHLVSEDHDVVFDQSLMGSWSVTDEKCTTLLTIASKGKDYDVQSTEQGGGMQRGQVPPTSYAGEAGRILLSRRLADSGRRV